MRENPWLQFQGRQCVLLNVRYAPIATKFRIAMTRCPNKRHCQAEAMN